MASRLCRLRQTFVLLCLFVVACLLPAAGCSCDSPAPLLVASYLPCVPQHSPIAVAAPLTQAKSIVPGAVPASYSTTASGNASVSIALDAVAGRGAPALTLSYDSSSAAAGPLGLGFAMAGVDAVTRCPKTMAIDDEQRGFQYDDEDALCLSGKRLVVVAKHGDTIEYRTFPDEQIKVMGHFEDAGASHFEAFFPSGDVITFGDTPGARPMAIGGMPRAWLASEKRDPRGNVEAAYGYCFANTAEGYTAEYALDEIRYTNDTRAVALVYGHRDAKALRTGYARGMALQESLELREMQMLSSGNELATRYAFRYDTSEATGRSRLTSVQECGADGACTVPTRFHYEKVETGFEEINTKIAAPLSQLASPLVADFNGDGLSDVWMPDVIAGVSTQSMPLTQWRIVQSNGNGFASAQTAFVQGWSFNQNPSGPEDPAFIQPEMGTAIPYGPDGRMGVLLHDVYGNRNHHIVLLSKSDGTFEEIDTGIERPFPLGPAPKQLRSAGASVHLAAVTPGGMPSLIQCDDHSKFPRPFTWTLRAWKPDGFDLVGTIIDTLDEVPCDTEMHTVDIDADGIVDLVVPGLTNVGGQSGVATGVYVVHSRRSDGLWEAHETTLHTPPAGQRTLFVDVNGDGLPDAVNADVSGRLWTWINTGKGFSDKGKYSVQWDGLFPQHTYLHLATTADFDGDGRGDILLPMFDASTENIPRWVILRGVGTSGEYTFERNGAGIPFEAQLGDAVTIADPRGPRVGDFDGNGTPDVAIFLGNELHIFRNRAADPDVVVGFSDGMNDHDADEPGFIPNVEIVYGHLTDESRTKGAAGKETDFYLVESDATNGCAYPRHCAVGSRRAVKEFRLNDAQGGQRRYGLRYRDGRYDRLGGGFLGFGKRILTDLDTGASTADNCDNVTQMKIGERDVYPFAGQIQQQWHWAPGLSTQPKPKQVEMAFAERTIDVVPTNGGATYFTLPTKLHTRRMQGTHSGSGSLETWVTDVEKNENATMLRDSTVHVLDYDEHRNMLEVDVSTVGVDATLHVERTVKNDVSRWNLGQQQWQEECSTASGKTLCRTIARTTNPFGEVDTETTSSSDGIADTKLTVKYDQRDKYGNVTHVAADDAFGNHRESTTIYDADGVFPTKHIDALGHATVVAYDAALGVVKTVTDANGLMTEFMYDSLGRRTSEVHPDGSYTTIIRTREKVGDVWRTKRRTTTVGGGEDEIFFDSHGRPIRAFSHAPQPKGATSARVMQVIEYDRLSGNIAKRSVPAAEGTVENALLFDEYAYDMLAREIRHKTPWNAVTTTTYDGLFIDTTDPLFRHTKTEVDALSRPVVITDAAKGKTTHTYGPFNTLRSVTDPGNAVTTWTRDAFGRVRQLDEPDRGTTSLVHSGFGDLLSSTDAIGRGVTWAQDALGRVKTRTDTQAGKTLTTTWAWDTATNGKGMLHSVTSPDGVKTYSYTKRGQPEGMTLSVADESFAGRVAYNELGQVASVDYPWPMGEQRFQLKYDYDQHGHRIAVRDKATGDAFWELTEVDDAGRYQKELFGNGVTTTRDYFDDKQTLKSITTTKGASTIQQASYDWDKQLNLKGRTDALQAQNKTERFRYDEVDRLTCAYFGAVEDPLAPCATSYSYMANGNLWSKSDVGTYSYADPKHPHAVTNVPGETFDYDAVGNQIARPGLVTVTYTPFDLPKTILQGAKTVSFGYDGDEKRIRKTTPTHETLYFGDIFEQVTTASGKEYRYYVHSPERVIAIVTHGGADAGTKYVHVDHLGSTDALTDAAGKVVERRSYDAHGKRRNPKWGEPVWLLSSKTTKGFTGHEEDDEFGLVNMRGRIYDARIGRFTTPDPVIPSIYDGQSFNGYSYTWNNPLTFTDPTGFAPEEEVKWVPGTWSGRPYVEPDAIVGVQIAHAWPTDLEWDTFVIPEHAANIGAYVPPVDVGTTGPGAPPTTSEGIGSFFEGLVFGGLSDNDSWSATAGSVIGGLIPGVGLAADIRDFAAAVDHVASGKEGAWLELGASVIGFVPGGDIAKGIAKGVTKATTKGATKIASEAVQEVAKVAKASTAKVADVVPNGQRGAVKARQATPRGPPAANGTKRPGARGHSDHQADVKGGGREQADRLKRPGERLESEKAVQGHPGIHRRADNQIIGTDERTRVVVESERRPGGAYHKKRVKELEAAGIEVHTRPPSQWGD